MRIIISLFIALFVSSAAASGFASIITGPTLTSVSNPGKHGYGMYIDPLQRVSLDSFTYYSNLGGEDTTVSLVDHVTSEVLRTIHVDLGPAETSTNVTPGWILQPDRFYRLVSTADDLDARYKFASAYSGTWHMPVSNDHITIRGYNPFLGIDDSVWIHFRNYTTSIAPAPVPAAAWLLGSGLIGLFGLRRKVMR